MKITNLSNKVKILLATHLAGVGLIMFYKLPETQFWGRLLFLLGGLTAGTVIWLFSDSGRSMLAYIKASFEEGRKVVWPTRQESVQLTLLVFVFVLILSLFMWLIDSFLFWLFNDLLLRRG